MLVLDQLSDPHNVGAILRTAAAFGVTAVVVQDRHAPPQSGALAKAASGALDMVPYVEVVNIARALDQLAEQGFWRIALAGDGEQSLAEAVPGRRCGAGAGIGRRRHPPPGARALRGRRLHPDRQDAMESLNVSNAAAIALYELRALGNFRADKQLSPQTISGRIACVRFCLWAIGIPLPIILHSLAGHRPRLN